MVSTNDEQGKADPTPTTRAERTERFGAPVEQSKTDGRAALRCLQPVRAERGGPSGTSGETHGQGAAVLRERQDLTGIGRCDAASFGTQHRAA